jgi:addiction module HigA family antidote
MSETMIPTHPGDVLKEELESRGISQKRFAEQTGVSYTMLNEILNGKRPVSTDFALIIEATLGINPQLLINMQARYNMAVSRKNKSFMQRLENLRKIAVVL